MKQFGLNLDDMIQFSQLMLRLQAVVRAIHVPGRDIKENDVEHSYHLAMMGWYLNISGRLGYNTDSLVRYALIHDLAEAYAGDVSALDAAGRVGKREREAAALERIDAEFPLAEEIIAAVHRYETLADDEARFIYALDKLMPMVMVYLADGRTWREEHQGFSVMHECQAPKIAVSEPVSQLYEQLRLMLVHRPQLFGAAA
ncbi:MAG TPA: HD domain-containing protein [Candidatus Saccharimonadia bacterium]|nr:HD domain-containing protein [Candidatus Saccharimonadia bacterium]